ncbi:MAG: hypothetical protein Q9M12_08020 [Mariprofundus sp.]|nr:hypothetical protein [Mariprofundus sp.]
MAAFTVGERNILYAVADHHNTSIWKQRKVLQARCLFRFNDQVWRCVDANATDSTAAIPCLTMIQMPQHQRLEFNQMMDYLMQCCVSDDNKSASR